MDVQVSEKTLGFIIPTFGEMLTFIVKGFFVIAGIATMIMLLWGALAWVLSGGDKEQVEAARNRMVAALVGLFLILVALSTVWTLEQIVFQRTMCFGLSCPVSIPQLLNSTSKSNNRSGDDSSHIFAKPTPLPTSPTGSGAAGQAPGTTSNGGTRTGTGTRILTPTGLQKLPDTGL